MTMATNERQRLQDAITLIKAGDKSTAEKLLVKLLQDNPQNELAWLWLATITNNLTKKERYLQKVIQINPANETAINSLQKLHSRIDTQSRSAALFEELDSPSTEKLDTINMPIQTDGQQTVYDNNYQGLNSEDLLREQIMLLAKLNHNLEALQKQQEQHTEIIMVAVKKMIQEFKTSQIAQVPTNTARLDVAITDVRMTISNMATFMIKWAIATIPAGIVLIMLGTLVMIVLGIGSLGAR